MKQYAVSVRRYVPDFGISLSVPLWTDDLSEAIRHATEKSRVSYTAVLVVDHVTEEDNWYGTKGTKIVPVPIHAYIGGKEVAHDFETLTLLGEEQQDAFYEEEKRRHLAKSF